LDGSSSEDDWIVDDDETTEAKKKRKEAKKKNRARMTDQEKEAAEIFGTSALRLVCARVCVFLCGWMGRCG
jgi:hypothetical protein